MEQSLITPNQCQKYGIKICDDPNDPHRKLIIGASEDLFIQMVMEGSTCGIITHPPTDYHIHGCQRILLSDKFDWYPSNNLFEIYSMEEEYMKRSKIHCYVTIVEIIITSAPPTIQCRYDLLIHEFDIKMANVSIRLAQDLMVDILINNVSVRRTRSGYATYTYKQHYGISSDMLARKWGIGLDKANFNLQSTT